MRRAPAAVLVMLCIARGAAADPPRSRDHLLKHATYTAVGGIVWIFSESAFKADLAPSACRWCATPGVDRAIRDGLKWSDARTGLASSLSNFTGFFLAPGLPLIASAATTWRQRGIDDGLDDSIAIVEAGVTTALLDQIVKFTVGRQRPFVHFGDPARAHDPDDDLSFYSGHTSLAFAMATAGGTVASKRSSVLAPWIWGGGLAVAATTGYLRIAADKHYATDVVVGAIMGSAAGLLMPRWFHGQDFVLVPAPGGLAVVGTF